MSSRDQLGSNNTDDQTSKILPEGFVSLITSAANLLHFSGPAEREFYKNNPANAAQLGKNRGAGDVRGR